MRDYNFYFYRFVDDEVEALSNLLEWKEASSFWRSLSNEDRLKFGNEVNTRIAALIPKEYKPSKKITIPYNYLLEIAYSMLTSESKDAPPSKEIIDIEKEIITRIFEQILSKASPEEKKKIYDSLNMEANKVGIDLKLSDLAPSATILSTIILGQLGGFTTYLLATTATGFIASAIGVTLPFAFYTTLTSAIATLLGPPGWIAGGIMGILGFGTVFSRAKDRRNKLRLLSVVTCLIKIKYRISEALNYITSSAQETLQAMEEEIRALNELLEEQEQEMEKLRDAKLNNEDLKTKLEIAENQNKKLYGLVEQHRKLLELEKKKGFLEFPLDFQRDVSISSGADRPIWGNVRITKLADIHSEKDRNLFKILMRHKNVQKILLSDYDGSSNPKPTIPPILHLHKEKACLKGKLLTTAEKKNVCRVSIIVDSGSEDSVIRYGILEGIISVINR